MTPERPHKYTVSAESKRAAVTKGKTIFHLKDVIYHNIYFSIIKKKVQLTSYEHIVTN